MDTVNTILLFLVFATFWNVLKIHKRLDDIEDIQTPKTYCKKCSEEMISEAIKSPFKK